jgi:hypothetical protein
VIFYPHRCSLKCFFSSMKKNRMWTMTLNK